MSTREIICQARNSGAVSIESGRVFYYPPSGGMVEIDLDDIAIIGSYKTDDGPFDDDWFLVLVAGDASRIDISWYAEDVGQLSCLLTQKFGVDFGIPYLTRETKWKSVVRYPQSLAGKEVFKMTPPRNYKVPQTLLQKVKRALVLGVYGQPWSFEWSSEVRDYLQNHNHQRKGPGCQGFE